MGHVFDFCQETLKPETIPGNKDNTVDPVEFDLVTVDGSALALLKGLMYASSFLSFNVQPSSDQLKAAEAGLSLVGPAFVQGVDAVRGLRVPDAMARRLGLRKPDDKVTTPLEISTGLQYARIAAYDPALALEVGFRLIMLAERTKTDARTFGSPTTSPANDSGRSGIARGARRQKRRDETAGSGDRTARG